MKKRVFTPPAEMARRPRIAEAPAARGKLSLRYGKTAPPDIQGGAEE